MKRVIVTGSRDWTDVAMIHDALRSNCLGTFDWITVIHGACPTGADQIADEWASSNLMPVERYPADWETYGRTAGPRRNAEMVAAGADLCLAFIGPCTSPRCRIEEIDHYSHGALGCAQLAELAGIEVRRWFA